MIEIGIVLPSIWYFAHWQYLYSDIGVLYVSWHEGKYFARWRTIRRGDLRQGHISQVKMVGGSGTWFHFYINLSN